MFYEYVIDNIKKNNKNFLSAEEGIKSLKIINSIYKSSEQSYPFEIKKIKDTFLGSNKKNNINL